MMVIAVDIVAGVLALSLGLVLVRLLRGPSLADRVVALDLLAVLGVSLLALLGLRYQQPALLDVAILLGLVGFVGSVAFARIMESGRLEEASPRSGVAGRDDGEGDTP